MLSGKRSAFNCGYFCFSENKSNPNINFKLMYMEQSIKSKGFEHRLLLIMWGLLLSLSAFAQQITVKGHVVDATANR